MKNTVRTEFLTIILFAIIYLILLYPAIMHARRETRDGIRRQELHAFKKILEQEYNKNNSYPLKFAADPHRYFVLEQSGDKAVKWYLEAKLENFHPNETSFDNEKNVYFRYFSPTNNETYYNICGGDYRCEQLTSTKHDQP